MSNSKEKIFEYIEQLENEIQALQRVHEYDVKMIDEVKGNAVKLYKEIDELKEDKQKLIEKLEKDIVNITKTMQDGKHYDDYSRCRLKAYRTKTNEILSIVKGE